VSLTLPTHLLLLCAITTLRQTVKRAGNAATLAAYSENQPGKQSSSSTGAAAASSSSSSSSSRRRGSMGSILPDSEEARQHQRALDGSGAIAPEGMYYVYCEAYRFQFISSVRLGMLSVYRVPTLEQHVFLQAQVNWRM
jgi:hypothetical protein